MLHLIHQRAHVIGHRIHTKGIQTTIEHVGLDTYLIERLTEGTYCQVGVLTCHQVHLLEGSTVCLHTGKTSHIDNCRSDTL